MFPLKGVIQHYNWGGYDFIPGLLGIANNDRRPYAEYWLGAHRNAPSRIVLNGQPVSLDSYISESHGEILGDDVRERFGELPYLLKILDVREMLSIQVHPSRQHAEAGFRRENEAGIPLDALHRIFRDNNHKPEVMVALSEFWLLHGFRSHPRMIQILKEIPEFQGLLSVYEQAGYPGLYREAMEMPAASQRRILQSLLSRALDQQREGNLQKHDPSYWVARALGSGMTSLDNPDKGIFSIYFFNIVRLLPGEGIFQAAGVPHAYLEGQNVELMSNSDNVLRGGLTSKHVDMAEFLLHTTFSETIPQILLGYAVHGGIEKKYLSPVRDFELSSIHLNSNAPYTSSCRSVDILLVLSGTVSVSGSTSFSLHKGDSFIAFCGEDYEIRREEEALMFKASVPF